MITAGPQPAEHLAHDSAASADAQAPAVVHEHRQSPAGPARPQMARLHRLAGDGAPPPGRRDVDAAGPVTGRGAETADLLQHEGDEGRYGATVPTRLRHCARTLAQLPFDTVVERAGHVLRERGEPRGVEQQPAVAEAVPSGHAGLPGGVCGAQCWPSALAKRTNRSRSRVTRG